MQGGVPPFCRMLAICDRLNVSQHSVTYRVGVYTGYGGTTCTRRSWGSHTTHVLQQLPPLKYRSKWLPREAYKCPRKNRSLGGKVPHNFGCVVPTNGNLIGKQFLCSKIIVLFENRTLCSVMNFRKVFGQIWAHQQ